jgi:hypothetical protein
LTSLLSRDRAFLALGWVIPWFTADGLALVKIRQPDVRRPKYAEAFRDPARLACYPSLETVRMGRPVVVVEGELDALCLGQELGELAAVVTLGSESARPTMDILWRFPFGSPWFVATDADAARDKAAEGWPARARGVKPPASFKHWNEAKAAGVDLHRWWQDVLSGIEKPQLFSWDELSPWRWGPSKDNSAHGIVVHRDHRSCFDALAEALDPASDPYTAAEREGTRLEGDLARARRPGTPRRTA